MPHRKRKASNNKRNKYKKRKLMKKKFVKYTNDFKKTILDELYQQHINIHLRGPRVNQFIDEHFLKKYPKSTTLNENDEETLTAEKRRDIKSLIKSWQKNNDTQFTQNTCSPTPNTLLTQLTQFNGKSHLRFYVTIYTHYYFILKVCVV